MSASGTQITSALGGTFSTNYWYTCPEGTIDRGAEGGASHLRVSYVSLAIAILAYAVSGIEIG